MTAVEVLTVELDGIDALQVEDVEVVEDSILVTLEVRELVEKLCVVNDEEEDEVTLEVIWVLVLVDDECTLLTITA